MADSVEHEHHFPAIAKALDLLRARLKPTQSDPECDYESFQQPTNTTETATTTTTAITTNANAADDCVSNARFRGLAALALSQCDNQLRGKKLCTRETKAILKAYEYPSARQQDLQLVCETLRNEEEVPSSRRDEKLFPAVLTKVIMSRVLGDAFEQRIVHRFGKEKAAYLWYSWTTKLRVWRYWHTYNTRNAEKT
jgi:hypothetical protein